MTKGSIEVHHRVCHLCEAMCGLVIKTERSKVVDIRGDQDDPLSRDGMSVPKPSRFKTFMRIPIACASP
jgi:anaerobic selenocysteine-containing dehydrogenase